jgi:DNA-binding NarL/FixJ family response regulator
MKRKFLIKRIARNVQIRSMSIHVFATIMALYPISSAQKIAEEFGLSAYQVKKMARICRVKKDKKFLCEVCRRNALKAAERQRRLRRRRVARAIRLFNQGHTNVEIARIMKVSVATVYKYKKTMNI